MRIWFNFPLGQWAFVTVFVLLGLFVRSFGGLLFCPYWIIDMKYWDTLMEPKTSAKMPVLWLGCGLHYPCNSTVHWCRHYKLQTRPLHEFIECLLTTRSLISDQLEMDMLSDLFKHDWLLRTQRLQL